MNILLLLGGLALLLLLLLPCALLFRTKTKKTRPKLKESVPTKEKLNEQQEMLEGAREMARDNPERAAEMLREWMRDGE